VKLDRVWGDPGLGVEEIKEGDPGVTLAFAHTRTAARAAAICARLARVARGAQAGQALPS